jgi:hypothetical protein
MTISEMTETIIKTAEHQVIPIVLALVVLVIAIYLGRHKISSRWLNYKTAKSLNRLGQQQIVNVKWPDGLGHYFTIDRLILRPDGISLLIYKRYPGKIFCADKIDDWTQMLGKRSYRFKNPLADLDFQVKVISACVPGVPVNGYLFFDHLTEFPKGHPERVIHFENMPEELRENGVRHVEASVMSAWNKLLHRAKK